MRLNYDTFTGRRSAFVCVSFCLILLSWVAFAVFSPQLTALLKPHLPGNRLVGAMLLIQNGLVPLCILIAALLTDRKYSMKQKFALKFENGYTTQFLFAKIAIAVLVALGVQIGLSFLLKAVGHEPKEQSLVEFFRTLKPVAFVCFSIITVIIAPIAEELAFRHIFYRFVRVFLYKKEAAVAVSLIFALIHLPLKMPAEGAPFPWELLVVPVVPLFVLALFLQREYEQSCSVIPSILMHSAFNLVSVILLTLEVYYGVGA